MVPFSAIKSKLEQSGFQGLLASGMLHTANRLEASRLETVSADDKLQGLAHKVLSRYTSFEGKSILEIGGAQSCESAYPFLQDGAARVVVTGLDHISQEQPSTDSGCSLHLILNKIF